MTKEHLHQDPYRLKKLQQPIEQSMIDIHTKGQKQMLVDVTKLLVKFVKEK